MQGSIAPHHQVAQGDDGTGLPCPDCPSAQHRSGFRPIGSHSAKAVPEVSLTHFDCLLVLRRRLVKFTLALVLIELKVETPLRVCHPL